MHISNKLQKILSNIDSPISQEILTLENGDIAEMDVTGANNLISYKKGKHQNRSKIGSIVKSLFGKKYTDKDIWKFVEEYKKEFDSFNTLDFDSEGEEFKWIANKFRELTTRTYPHGTEDDVLPLMDITLSKDDVGNYYKIINGDNTTMFTSHLDTASHRLDKVGYRVGKDNKGNILAYTDGTSILGADDKAGVTIMLWMIKHNIPGIYYFFIGEERGMIGSSAVAGNYENFNNLKEVTKCISFDRRDVHSIITSQMGRQCCSSEFANSLIKELAKGGMKMSQDPTGIYTDSAAFIEKISECTNISVGYYSEHTTSERQNLNHLTTLAKSCLLVDWKNLIVSRKIGYSDLLKSKYGQLIKYNRISNRISFEEENTLVIYLEIESDNLEDLNQDVQVLTTLLGRGGYNYSTSYVGSIIKLKLN